MSVDLKRCSKCGIISLKSKFHKDKTKNDGLKSAEKIIIMEIWGKI